MTNPTPPPLPDRPVFSVTEFEGLWPVDKLVWFFIRDYPGSWSKYTLSAALGIAETAAYFALKKLLERGLLEVTSPGRGRRAASYRVARKQ